MKISKRKVLCASAKRGRRINRSSVMAADSDYIKIGNMVIPKDASQYGYDSYENIQKDTRRRYDAEKAAEKEAAERAAREQKGAKLYEQVESIVNSGNTASEQLQELFDLMVPRAGSSDTAAGELVRAMMRLQYRWHNDGDMFNQGYGLETCAPSAAYLCDNVEPAAALFEQLTGIMEGGDQQYEDGLNDLQSIVIDYIVDNPELCGMEPPADSRDYHSETVDWFVEAGHSYEYELDVSGDLEEYVRHGCISWTDVEYMVEELTRTYGGKLVAWAADGFTITNLTSDEYEEWDRMWIPELNAYLESLEEEFPNYGEEDDEYDEEYDEGEDY